jgi:thioredoxin-related protein
MGPVRSAVGWLAPVLGLLLLGGAAGAVEAPRDPYAHFFSQTLGDFTEELATARKEGKKGILIFFEMEECPFCHRMKETVLNQPKVQDWYRQHFLAFSVDVEGDVEITGFDGKTMRAKDFAGKVHRVRATPVFAFFDLQGNVVARYTGATHNAEEFLWLGEFVAAGHYQTTNFTRFKRERLASRQQSSGPR